MAITVDNLIFYKSERMTDLEDGGGQMTNTPIQPGVENQIFDDISDVDRAVGDVSIRKIYAAVTSEDTAKYLDSGVIIFKPPTDPTTSIMAFSSGNFYDMRTDLQNIIEQTITRGSRWNGFLWGNHSVGQRIIVLWQRANSQIPSVNDRLELVTSSTSEFVWVVAVSKSARTITDDKGDFLIDELTLEISEGLEYNYTGSEAIRNTPSNNTLATTIYSTRYNSNAAPLHGIMPLKADSQSGDFTVHIDNLYMPIIPTSFVETPIPDATPGTGQFIIAPGRPIDNPTVFNTTSQSVKPNVSLYLGNPCYPGTLNIAYATTIIKDDSTGNVNSGTIQVGTIDYGSGVIQFNEYCPNLGSQNKTVQFVPAGKISRFSSTASILVTVQNLGFVWIMNLYPPPTPGTLSASYMVNSKWYTLLDQGNGTLIGADSSYGSAKLNTATGTIILTTGAKPDVGSEIIFTWGGDSNNSYIDPNTAFKKFQVTGQTGNTNITPKSVAVTWGSNSLTDVAATHPGELTGTGGTGFINYKTGAWAVIPDLLPNQNQQFTINYNYSEASTKTFNTIGLLNLVDTNIVHNSIKISTSIKAPASATRCQASDRIYN